MTNVKHLHWPALLGGVFFCCLTACSSTRKEETSQLECVLDETSRLCTVQTPEQIPCETYREYITTFSYLLDRKDASFTKDQASRQAFRVAAGCTGAAKRFIQVFELLSKSKLAAPEALNLAETMAVAKDESAATFTEVFRTAFLGKYLDLSLVASIELARSIALDPAGGSRLAHKEFEKLVDFCLDKKGLGLSKPECAQLSAEVLSFDSQAKTKNIGSAFISFLEFLRADQDGPQLTTVEALKLSKSLMRNHVASAKNFIPAYKFAKDKQKLALTRDGAVAFAQKLASLSRDQRKLGPNSPAEIKADAGNQLPIP